MSSEITTSSVVTPALIDLLLSKGMSREELDERVGLKGIDPEDPDLRVSYGVLLKLWEAAVEKTGNQALGLDLVKSFGTRRRHFVAQLVLSAEDMRTGLEDWARYAPVVCEAERMEIRDEGRYTTIAIHNHSPAHQNIWMPQHYAAMGINYGRRYTGKPINAVEIHSRDSDPGYADYYREVLGGPVYFNRDENRLVLNSADLALPMSTVNHYMKTFLVGRADSLLTRLLSRQTITIKARSLIMENLPRRDATADRIASSMRMDRRTLHRKLKKEGTTYRVLLEKTRRDLADNYLRRRMSITETSYLLGFSEPSAFQHAFKEWFGMSPGEYRRTH